MAHILSHIFPHNFPSGLLRDLIFFFKPMFSGMPHPMKPVLRPQGPSETFCFPLFAQNGCKGRLWPAAAQNPSLVWPFGPCGIGLGTVPFAVAELRAPEVAKWSTLAYHSSKAVIHVSLRPSIDLFWHVPIPMAHFICGYLRRGDKQVKQRKNLSTGCSGICLQI